MAKFKVRFTETRTYVHEEVVEADNRDAAIFAVEKKGFEFPDDAAHIENDSDAEEIADLTDAELETLRRWVTRVTFFDEGEDGIGEAVARFRVRDDPAFMERVRDALSHDNAKKLICGIIDSFAHPCENYADDFDDPDSAFKVSWEYLPKSHMMEIRATIRT